MGKLMQLVLLITLLSLDATLQAKGKNSRKNRQNSTAVASPRTFWGNPINSQIKTPKSFSTPNSTEARTPSAPSSSVPPALELLSNSTVDYLTGALSTRVIPGVYIFAVAVGIPANVAILVVLGAKVRTISSAILYCSLAVSDLLLLLSLVLKAHYHLRGNHWVFGEAACRVTTACFYGNLYCSAHTLTCVSAKRYLAVVHPFLYKSLPKRACAIKAGLAVWAVFGVAMVPELLVRQSYRLPQLGVTTCHDVLPLDQDSHHLLLYYNLGLTCLGFLLPLLVTTACYASIVWHLNRSHHDWGLYIKASAVVFLIFLVCFGPSSGIHFLHYVRLYVSREESFYAYFNVAVCLCCLHSCLDPFLFVLMSRTTGSKLCFTALKGKTLSLSA